MKKFLLLLKTGLALPMRNKVVQQNYFKAKVETIFFETPESFPMNKIKKLPDFNTSAK